MAKFYGSVGFAETVETAPDVWMPQIVEHQYAGDILRNTKRWQAAQQVNDNLVNSVQISIIADPYAISHYGFVKYVVLHGTRWKVTSVEPQHPRLILELGEVYNGDGPEEEEEDDGE